MIDAPQVGRQAGFVRRIPAFLLAASISGFALAVLGAALCLELVSLLSVGATAITAAAAAALVVSGTLARVAAAVGVGSVVGTLVMIVAVTVHAQSGCLVLG